MSKKTTNRKKPNGRGQQRHTKEDWVRTALDTLISEGVENVKILALSGKLETARSSFYWHFENREDLLDTLLERWRQTNTKALIKAAQHPADSITQAITNVYASWVGVGEFNTRLDFAIRDWARRSGSVRRALDISDDARIEALFAMFKRFGFNTGEAEIRARVLYFTQIGYDALDQRESWETRASRARDYLFCISGQRPSDADVERLQKLRD